MKINRTVDRPFADIYDTESRGWSDVRFFARPVVGGHFSFLALERACDGKAVAGLDFLNEEEPKTIDVAKALNELDVDMVVEDL